MTLQGWFLILAFTGILLALAKPVGLWLHALYEGRRTPLHLMLAPVERGFYHLSGIDPAAEQGWRRYAVHMLLFNVALMAVTYAVLRLQGVLPGNPQGLAGLSPHLAFNTAITVLPQIEAKRLRAIAISTLQRFPPMPDLPTVDEAGVKGFDGGSWQGVGAPAGTPAEVIRRVNTLLVTELKTPAMREQMIKRGALVSANSPEEFSTFIRAEIAKWTKIAKAGNISID